MLDGIHTPFFAPSQKNFQNDGKFNYRIMENI